MFFAFNSKMVAALAILVSMMAANGDQATLPGAAPSSGQLVPPANQQARCVGVDETDHRQSLSLESRWLPAESRTALIVVEDSSGVLKAGEWLENQNSMYRDGSRKWGLALTWDDTSFSKRVSSQYARITFQETGIDSASVLYVSRPFSDRDLTGKRFSARGTIQLAGHCRLYVGGEKRTFANMPKLGRTL